MKRWLRLVVAIAGGTLAAAAAGCSRQPTPPGNPIEAAVQSAGHAGLGRTAADGRRRFVTSCAPCHGDEGRGDGQNASRLAPRPADLRGAATRLSREEIRRIVDAGTAAAGRSPLCPPHGRTLGSDAVDAIVTYVETLGREAGGPPR